MLWMMLLTRRRVTLCIWLSLMDLTFLSSLYRTACCMLGSQSINSSLSASLGLAFIRAWPVTTDLHSTTNLSAFAFLARLRPETENWSQEVRKTITALQEV